MLQNYFKKLDALSLLILTEIRNIKYVSLKGMFLSVLPAEI